MASEGVTAKLLSAKKTSLPSIVVEDRDSESGVGLTDSTGSIFLLNETTERNWTSQELRYCDIFCIFLSLLFFKVSPQFDIFPSLFSHYLVIKEPPTIALHSALPDLSIFRVKIADLRVKWKGIQSIPVCTNKKVFLDHAILPRTLAINLWLWLWDSEFASFSMLPDEIFTRAFFLSTFLTFFVCSSLRWDDNTNTGAHTNKQNNQTFHPKLTLFFAILFLKENGAPSQSLSLLPLMIWHDDVTTREWVTMNLTSSWKSMGPPSLERRISWHIWREMWWRLYISAMKCGKSHICIIYIYSILYM